MWLLFAVFWLDDGRYPHTYVDAVWRHPTEAACEAALAEFVRTDAAPPGWAPNASFAFGGCQPEGAIPEPPQSHRGEAQS